MFEVNDRLKLKLAGFSPVLALQSVWEFLEEATRLCGWSQILE